MPPETPACQKPWPPQKAHPVALWPHGLVHMLMVIAMALSLQPKAAKAAPLQPELEAQQAFEQARTEIRERRYDRAEILLERVLMLQPENAEALIELALLMAARNHQEGALALVQSLIDDPRTESHQAQALKNLQAHIQQKATNLQRNPYALNSIGPRLMSQGQSQTLQPVGGVGGNTASSANPVSWRSEIQWGMTTNPLARTSAQAITITLPDGPLSLPLTQNQREGHTAGASLVRTTATGGAELATQATNISGTSNAARLLGWRLLPPAPWLGNQQQPIWLAFAQAQRGLDGQQRAQAGLTAISEQQKYSLSAYHENSNQDRGLNWRVEHHPKRWQGILGYAALERSQSTTGPQGHWRAMVVAERPVAEQAKVMFQWTQQHDTYSYSPLLENGARRQLAAVHVAYEQRHQLKNQKMLTWRVFTGERRSNLSLFSYKETGFQVGLAHKWP